MEGVVQEACSPPPRRAGAGASGFPQGQGPMLLLGGRGEGGQVGGKAPWPCYFPGGLPSSGKSSAVGMRRGARKKQGPARPPLGGAKEEAGGLGEGAGGCKGRLEGARGLLVGTRSSPSQGPEGVEGLTPRAELEGRILPKE